MRRNNFEAFNRVKLKPCPLCGGKLSLRRWSKTTIKGETKRNCYCYCKDCDLRGPRVLYEDYATQEEAEEMAMLAMNERPQGEMLNNEHKTGNKRHK